MSAWMLKTYLTVKNKWDSFKETEDGMETVQAIILVVVGIIIVGALIGIVGSKDKQDSIIGKMWAKITTLIDNGEDPYNP